MGSGVGCDAKAQGWPAREKDVTELGKFCLFHCASGLNETEDSFRGVTVSSD